MLEHARSVHLRSLPDPQAVHDGLAVAVPAVPKRARAPGREADDLVEGLVAGGDAELADTHEELGGGAEDGRVGEA